MRLFTEDDQGQFRFIGDYDIAPARRGGTEGRVHSRRRLFPSGTGRIIWTRYKKTVIGVFLGLLVGILFITIGFFKTLLLLILTSVGFIVGGFFDRNPVVLKFLDNIG